MKEAIEKDDSKCRLDKWLWAARFYKTRSIAADAVDSGKVRVDGDRAKTAKEIKTGMLISIRSKEFEIEVEVTGLSNIRRGAPEAALLYAETEQSKTKRENAKITREADYGIRERGAGRPTKRQQREIKKFTGIF
ncbi:MAG: RNA-binding protein [Methylotenera sp.]|nr:MAG: RNA-binding protein [Proteobacteria bacterium ST_bin12]PPD55056.1 MAG: RNA-binding protein [Methylotenera sp.]